MIGVDLAILIAVFLGWVVSITSVIVGGYIGYRAKHGGYEPFVNLHRSPKGAFNLSDPNGDFFSDDTDGDAGFSLPEVAKRMNDRFHRQMKQQAANDLGVNNAA